MSNSSHCENCIKAAVPLKVFFEFALKAKRDKSLNSQNKNVDSILTPEKCYLNGPRPAVHASHFNRLRHRARMFECILQRSKALVL